MRVRLGTTRARRRLVAIASGLVVAVAAVVVPTVANAGETTETTLMPTFPTRVSGDPRPGKNLAPQSPEIRRGPGSGVRLSWRTPTPGPQGRAFQTGKGSPSANVVGGSPALSTDFPGVVGVVSVYWVGPDPDDYEGAICTGTVLSATKVLTAAHCIVDVAFGTTWVYAGRSDLFEDSGGFIARVGSTWTHQNFNLAALYDGTADVPVDDVSVLTLKDTLPDAYTPVTLSDQGDQTPYAEDTSATIAGYGLPSDSATEAGVLYSATVPIKSDATCSSAYPSWYDAARMTCAGDTTAGISTCHGDSGGPLFVDGKQVGITDWGLDPCSANYAVYERLSYYSDSVKEDLTRPSLINLDWTGDGHSDLFTRTPDGFLLEWSGSGLGTDGFGGFSAVGNLGPGWGGFKKLFRVTSWHGDGKPSIMALDSLGRLWEYKGTGEDSFNGPSVQIGSGWNSFVDIMVTNNWTGDGHPNLMGRTSTGDLILYTSNGAGGWLNPRGTKIGTGWNSFNTVLTPGSWKGDGFQSLIGRNSKGELILYVSNGAGGWQNPKGEKIGSGWGSLPVFMSPGDWNGDNMIDLIGVTSAGAVRLYTTNGHGQWINARGQLIMSGWSGLLLF